MKKLIALVAFGAGYVLGSKAGRQRYDQIRALAQKARGNPLVQQAAQQAADLARDKGPAVGHSVRHLIGTAAHDAASSVRQHTPGLHGDHASPKRWNGGPPAHAGATFQPDPEAPLAPETADAWHATSHRA